MLPGLGISLFIAGLVFVVLVWVVLRVFPRTYATAQANANSFSFPESSKSQDAVIILQPGGRVEYISDLARTYFNMHEKEPHDLERLARRVRPTDDFLDLCATPGHKRVSINGKQVEISSFEVPGTYPMMLVSLRGKESVSTLEQGNGVSEEILHVITEFSQSIAANLDLKMIVQSILDNVSRLVSSDRLELNLWDAENQVLTPYHFESPDSSSVSGVVRATTSQFGSLTEQLVARRAPVMLADARSQPELAENGELLSIQSYLGVPLITGGELVGTLEAGQTGGGAFGQHDLDLLFLISGQAAVAIRNAKLYEDEQKRVSELAGLANLNQSLGAVRDMQDLFARLVESVAPLFAAEIIGFLLYDEERRTLEGKNPFRGLPPHLVQIYRAAIAVDSPAEQVITNQQPLLTLNASTDENWQVLGLSDIAMAASLRDIALMPLLSSGRMLGYLQVGHHQRGTSSFTMEELRLMNIVANQAAAIIENVLLVQQARARAQRSDALRRIASLSGSSATLEEILKYSVQELANLFQADTGAVFLMDETRGELRLRRESTYGISDDISNSFIQIFVDDPNYHYTVSGSQKPLLSGSLSTDRRILPVYRSLATTLLIESAIVVPLVVRERSIGELMLGSFQTDHFNSYDLQVVATAAGQLAAAVESASLLIQTDDSLRRRVDQLSAIIRTSRELSASLDLKHLLKIIHDEGLRVVQSDCSSILLFAEDHDPDNPRVELFVGCEGARELSSIEREVLQNREPRIIADFLQAPDSLPHDRVRSAIIAPITYQALTLGLINLHSNQPDFFTPERIELVQTLAIQAGIALNNAQHYQAEKKRASLMRRRADTLGRLTDVSYNLGHDQPLDQALQIIARGIHDSTPFRVVLMSVVEADTDLLRRVTAVGVPQETLNELLARKQPLQSVNQLMKPEFKVSHSYFIPNDRPPLAQLDARFVSPDAPTSPAQHPTNAWDVNDTLLVPLENAGGQLVGLISLDDPSSGLRPDKATIETVEVFAAQAALLVSNTMRQSELRSRIDSLSSGLQRQQKLIDSTQNNLPILLHKDLEQTISLYNLDQRTQRVRAGLAITKSVSRQLDASSALFALGRETLTQLGMSIALVAENTVDGSRLMHVLGSLPRSTNVESLFGQRNPLRACLQNGEPILISSLDENEEWHDASLLTSLRAKSVICLPVLVENKTVAAMLAISPEAMPDFTEEDRKVYLQISQQASLILQNISLLNQTRRRLDEVNLLLDFSRQLSGMDPDAILKSLLDSSRRVLQHAHAGVALMWNPQTETLTPRAVSGYADNASMMEINYRPGEALPGMVFLNKTARRVDEINFVRDYNLSPENLAIYRQATGGRLPVSSLLVPIITTDQNLGLLVLDNFNTTGAFLVEDEALLLSLAQQIALSLDNVRLVQTTQERAAQLHALNNAAASLTSSLRSDQLINSLLDQVVPIIPYDTATLWLREKDRLSVASARGFSDTEQRLGLSVSVQDSALFKEMAQTGQPIFIHDVREDPRFPPVEKPCLSWLGIPLISKGELVGVLAVEKWEAHFYTREQMQIGLTFASQSAVSLDNARLYEDSVSRATELDQRSQRLTTLNHFASALTGLLDTDQILNLTATELLKGLGAQHVSVVTFERGQAYWKMSAPRTRIKLPRLLPDSLIFHRLRESQSIFNTDDARTEPDLAPLMEMLGENPTALLILPLASGQNLTALVFAQMAGEARFGLNELEVARTITNQATVALENARLFQSSVRTAERFAILNETSSQISALDPEEVYVAVHKAAERLMPLESFVISLLDQENNEVDAVYLFDRGKRYAGERIPFGKGISSQVIQSGKPLLISSLEQANSMDSVRAGGEVEDDGDETQSIVAVPMILGGKSLGMLSVQSYQAGVYTEEDVQILGTLANQAIVAIQNGRLFAETQNLASQLEIRVVERTAQLQREQQNTETLLRILTEVSSSLDLDRALNRTLSLLNEAVGAQQGTIMLLQAEDNLLHYRAGYGYLTDRSDGSGRGFTLKVGEGLAGWVVQNREPVLSNDLHQDARWVRSSTSGQDHRSAIVVPMQVGEDVIGVLMVFQREANSFNTEMLNLVKAIGGQVAVAINNAHLYELIRDQAERLGVMLRKEQEDASRSQAILEAVADGVLVTGVDNHITFVNSSTERILAIEESKVLGNPLDAFGGLFGKSAGTWMETIRRWSEDPSAYQPGDTYAEQLELENERIALVHLAPVILQNDFLGTVSIFRDITREVEVDRLKSEFVTTVSHELRTPLTAIKGYVDILTMGAAGALNENQLHFLEIVTNNINRLSVLVNDLLDISRIEAGRVTLNPQPVDLREIAEDIVAEALRRSQNENKPMAISLDAPTKVFPVMGDGDRIRQIMGNLVDNAFNYTPSNGTIRINIHQQNGDLQVDVHDNGVGIATEDQARIFERFFRGEHPLVLATPGTGLGLPIVRQLVEMHNGHIWMTSTGVPGEGSTFSFTLPIYK
jgi:GAF domain-containing protein